MGRARTGWHFLQLPGPSNVPDRVLRAISRATIDHRGPDFPALTHEVLRGLRAVFRTEQPVVIYAASGTGGWEAAFVNTLRAGDRVLMFETGQFAVNWIEVARRFGLQIDVVETDWRRGADPDIIEQRLREDRAHTYRAVALVHNETSTGAMTRLAEVRRAMDSAQHPALLIVDAVSSVGCLDYRHDEWGIDVTIAASQKGLMLPPGLAFLAISQKARVASREATLPRSYWDWNPMIARNAEGYFPHTPSTNLLFGLREALAMLDEEGLEQVFCRHARYGRAARCAVQQWGLDTQCERADEQSDVLTTVVMPEGHDADQFRQLVHDRFNMSLGTGLGKLKGRVFRIGHVGDFNDLMLIATLAGVEAGLALSGVPIRRAGVAVATDSLVGLVERPV
ncbi:MAG: pyridoxal-phosphate-dependent aminotransferase family protein [Longimicrobiales bacterium]